MVWQLGIFFFILGTTIGSFLNVVIYRYNTGLGITHGRSKCFSCGKTLQWYELIPLVSYVIQRGKCSQCQSKISPQYFIVELLTGLTFLVLYLQNKDLLSLNTTSGLLHLTYSLIIASIFIVILVYDVRHKIIPDGLVILLSILSLGGLFVAADLSLRVPALIELLAGPILALPFALLWLVSGGRWMGLGDAKLALPMGWILGVSLGFSAIIIAFWVGALVGILLIFLDRLRSFSVHRFVLPFGLHRITMKSEIPFAPFLILGLAIVFFTGINVLFDLGAIIG